MEGNFYLHKIELATGRAVIVLDNDSVVHDTFTYLNDAPIMSSGKILSNKTQWTLGTLETENEAHSLLLALARHYGCDAMVDGTLLGLPYAGASGKWVSNSEAAALLGRIKSARKAQSSAENGKLGGRPRKVKSPPPDFAPCADAGEAEIGA